MDKMDKNGLKSVQNFLLKNKGKNGVLDRMDRMDGFFKILFMCACICMYIFLFSFMYICIYFFFSRARVKKRRPNCPKPRKPLKNKDKKWTKKMSKMDKWTKIRQKMDKI